MPGFLELIEKLLEEQRAVQKHQSTQAISAQTLSGMQTAQEGARIENTAAQTKFRADLELAQRAYPGMDPIEALVKFQADTAADKRDIERRTAESALSGAEAQRAKALADAERIAADAGRAPAEREQRARLDRLLERQRELENLNLEKYGRRQRPVPPAPKEPKPPKKYEPTSTDLKFAEDRLFMEGVDKPTDAQLMQKARELFDPNYISDITLDAAGGGAAGAGGAPPPAPPVSPGAAPSPSAPSGCPPGTKLAVAPGKPPICVRVK